MNVFWRFGYEHTSLDVLMREMGIARQSLYDTFGDKRALYLQALHKARCDTTLKGPLLTSHKRGYVVANNPKRSSTRRLSISLLVKTRTQMFAVNSWHQLDDESRKISNPRSPGALAFWRRYSA
jgi:hypothetical protein